MLQNQNPQILFAIIRGVACPCTDLSQKNSHQPTDRFFEKVTTFLNDFINMFNPPGLPSFIFLFL